MRVSREFLAGDIHHDYTPVIHALRLHLELFRVFTITGIAGAGAQRAVMTMLLKLTSGNRDQA